MAPSLPSLPNCKHFSTAAGSLSERRSSPSAFGDTPAAPVVAAGDWKTLQVSQNHQTAARDIVCSVCFVLIFGNPPAHLGRSLQALQSGRFGNESILCWRRHPQSSKDLCQILLSFFFMISCCCFSVYVFLL